MTDATSTNLYMNETHLEIICSFVNDLPRTLISSVWFWISFVFVNYWFLIIPVLTVWIVFEVLTRNCHLYNSDNGFTPAFNSFVGGGVFLGFESLIRLTLDLLLGNSAECSLIWVNGFYLLPFIATGLFLNLIGFWHYIKIPILNVKVNIFSRNRW